MMFEFSGKTSLINEDEEENFPVGPLRLLRMLQQRHERNIAVSGHVLAVAEAVKLESPLMDDDFLRSTISGMKQTGTWSQCGDWAALIKSRLGKV